ncbi:MAG: GNAT family N-acetyltransferase [Gomphosphaeria aponina SAG 52.96 = DSM 107014]|uniref:GNAT family N-acetyltransferase n=1 Tax=Gomphosphaeria aponina SAG 52.96 = DSM 107014 TaxID=1521640 RepID=A0A941JT16_9CHRO|nr:GNAT family N-acetyltransferase [Gomphosphaeria aponina SAG 52.96 = DSM 107014]
MHKTYQEIFSEQQDFSHLADTVNKYFNSDTQLWWVELTGEPIGCIWMGNAIDQVSGDRYAYIFLLYVKKKHRGQGIGKALMQHGENWAKNRGDRQIGLMVFSFNQSAINLYQSLGYETQSLLMIKQLGKRFNS